MPNEQEKKVPTIYQINVRGKLKESWSAWFDGMTISLRTERDGSPITSIIGPVVDQTALHGLLSKIRDLGLPLLYLNRVETDKQPSSELDESAEDHDAHDHGGKNKLWYWGGRRAPAPIPHLSFALETGMHIMIMNLAIEAWLIKPPSGGRGTTANGSRHRAGGWEVYS